MSKDRIEIYCAEDSAGFEIGNLEGYFGYEEIACELHPTGDPERECEKCEWCFTLKRDKKEIVRLRASQIDSGTFGETEEALLKGLLICISRGVFNNE